MTQLKNLTRREFLGASAAGLGALAFKPRIPGGPADGGRPNILFILTDDQRYDTMGCAGNRIIRTPNVDALAREGVRFDRAFVTTPICAASRASLLTGTFERTHTYTFTKPPLAGTFTDISYPVLLRKAGYRTGFVGKFGLAVEKGVEEEMFDFAKFTNLPHVQTIDGVERHMTEVEGEYAVEFLRGSRRISRSASPGVPGLPTPTTEIPSSTSGRPPWTISTGIWTSRCRRWPPRLIMRPSPIS